MGVSVTHAKSGDVATHNTHTHTTFVFVVDAKRAGSGSVKDVRWSHARINLKHTTEKKKRIGNLFDYSFFRAPYGW